MSYGETKRKRNKRPTAEEGVSISHLLQSAAIGVGAALLFAALFLPLGAMICYRSADPNQMTLPR